MNLVARAVIAQKWSQTSLNANIHALIGNNADKMVNEAGRVFYVVLGALVASEVDAEDPDVRIVRGAVNAVYDQAGVDQIDELRRASIVIGLQAAQRLALRMERRCLVDAACELDGMLKRKHVHMSDFESLFQSKTTLAYK